MKTFANELPNFLRLRMLGNKEMLLKSQTWVETQPSIQSPLHKYLALAVKNYAKAEYQSFLILSNFAYLLYFSKYILENIVDS